MVLLISSFEIINVVRLAKSEGRAPDPNIFLWVAAAAAAAAAAAINPNGIKTFLNNGLSTSTIKNNPVFSNDPKNLLRNHPACLILCNRVFDSFILDK